MLSQGLISEFGLKSITTAKQNGSWSILDSVENLEVPSDLNELLEKSSEAKNYFLILSNSSKKSLLQWIVMAKRTETRNKRIQEIVSNAALGRKPKQFV